MRIRFPRGERLSTNRLRVEALVSEMGVKLIFEFTVPSPAINTVTESKPLLRAKTGNCRWHEGLYGTSEPLSSDT